MPSDRIIPDCDSPAVNPLQDLFSQYLLRRSLCGDLSLPEEQEPICESSGQIDVMGDEDDRQPGVHGSPEQSQNSHLMPKVEAGRRLVQHQRPRCLSQSASDPDPLELPSRECARIPFGQIEGVALFKRSPDGFMVVRTLALEGSQVRVPPHCYELTHRDREGDALCLGHNPYRARQQPALSTT